MSDTENNLPEVNETKKELPVGMIAISIILAVILVFMVFMYFTQKSNMVEMEQVLTEEKDSLANELRKLAFSYDTLKSDNDTLNANLAKEKERIVQLLSINASNAELIRRYKSEITTMRDIMKSYIVQIDSLNTRNQILVAENQQIKQEISKVQNTNEELEKVKAELNAQVEVASVIQAKNIIPVALNKKNKETSKLSLLSIVRVCFTLRENPIASAGEKEVFLRVIRPDALVISTSSNNLFDFNGDKLIYSASRMAEYMNQDLEMCIYLEDTGDFVEGNYSVELYLEGNLIGTSSFMLK
jgi:Tfp pilus assembly protein PilN